MATEVEARVFQSLGFDAYERGSDGYEGARRTAAGNGRIPERHPELIMLPVTDNDVVAAVRHAIAHDMRISVNPGSHTGNASFLRDDGMLIDLSRMTRISVSVETGVAYAEPGAHGEDLNSMLGAHGLMFPSGHVPSVGVGGFLLHGGPGWNSRKWGVGAQNVIAIDVVTATGELVHADAHHHSELYWAARDAGPGFFGVVTRFHLATHPLPRAMMTSTYRYPVEAVDELLLWLDEIQPTLPADLEVSMVVTRDRAGAAATVALTGDALCESTTAAHRALSLLENSPVLDQVLSRDVMNPVGLDGLLRRFEELPGPHGCGYLVDQAWTSAPPRELMPALHDAIDRLPPAPAHLYVLWCGPARPVDDMAFSRQGRLILSLSAISAVAQHDEGGEGGIRLSDESIVMRPFAPMTDEALVRLERARTAYDPTRRFHSDMPDPKIAGAR